MCWTRLIFAYITTQVRAQTSKDIFLLHHGMHMGHVMSGVNDSATNPVRPVTWVHRKDISPSRAHLLGLGSG